MEIVRQLWRTSKAFRLIAAIAGLGVVLTVVTAGRREAPGGPDEPAGAGIVDRIRDRVSGGGWFGRAKRTGDKVLDVTDGALDTGEKVINATGRAVDKAADAMGVGSGKTKS